MSNGDFGDWIELPNGTYMNVGIPRIVRKNVSKIGYVLSYEPPGASFKWELAEVVVGNSPYTAQAETDIKRASLIPALRRPVTFAVHTWANQQTDEAQASQQCNAILLAALVSERRVRVQGYQFVLKAKAQVTLTLSDGKKIVLPGPYIDRPVQDFMRWNPHPYVTRVTFVA
jgi:hypothetical protein